jgi:hypothetical protein
MKRTKSFCVKLGFVIVATVLLSGSGLCRDESLSHLLIDAKICQITKNPLAFKGKTVRVRAALQPRHEMPRFEHGGCRIHPEFDQAIVWSERPEYKALEEIVHDRYLKTCADCFRAATATFVGRIETVYYRDKAGKVVRPESGGDRGYGHLNLAPTKLVIQSVSDVVAEPLPKIENTEQ